MLTYLKRYRQKRLDTKATKFSILVVSFMWLRTYKGHFYQNGNDTYGIFTHVYRSVVDKHALLKFKKVRAILASFMTKELRKSVMVMTKVRGKYLKWLSTEKLFGLQKSEKRVQCSLKDKLNVYFW